jgi:hypothetical protein
VQTISYKEVGQLLAPITPPPQPRWSFSIALFLCNDFERVFAVSTLRWPELTQDRAPPRASVIGKPNACAENTGKRSQRVFVFTDAKRR